MANNKSTTRRTNSNTPAKRGPGRPPKNPQAQTQSRRTSTTTNQKNNRQQPSVSEVTFWDYLHNFSKSRFFLPVAVVLITTIVVLLDLLFAWNNYGRFFVILGVELIAIAIFWLIKTVFTFGSEIAEDSESGS